MSTVAVAAAEQAAGTASAKSTVAPEKLKAIQDLLVASRTKRNAKMGFDLVFGQEIKGLSAALGDRIDRNPMLTSAQKADAKRIMSESLDRRRDRFARLFNEQIDLDGAIEDVYVPMFDKHFTLAEIKEMLTYFNSPVGQKSLNLLPQMSSEAAVALNVRLLPKLKEIGQMVDEQERAEAQDALKPKEATDKATPSPAAATPAAPDSKQPNSNSSK
jgi:hypothetical protein